MAARPDLQRCRGSALLPLLLASAITSACPLDLPLLRLSVGGHSLAAELAETPTARQCGLSHRTQLAADQGMLFVFPRRVRQAFWMKDTHIPLSIAFIDDQGVILAINDMVAEDTTTLHQSPAPYRYALETPRGWFVQRQIKPGDRLKLDSIPTD